MIIVLGTVKLQVAKFDDALALSHAHVQRSRSEPGCIAHAMHRDTEDGYCLVFVEKWADKTSLDAHFRVPESQEFIRDITPMCAEAPVMELYQAEDMSSSG
ncbi:MAG: putative quinol monooxygenase [Woeseiaceae bacterium]